MKNQKVSRKLYHFEKKTKKRRFEKTNFFLVAMKKKKKSSRLEKKFVHFWSPFFLSFFIIFTKWFIILLLFSIFKIELRYYICFYPRKNYQEKKKRRKFRRKLLHILSQNAKSFASNFKKVFGLKKTKNPCTLKKKSWYFDRRRY